MKIILDALYLYIIIYSVFFICLTFKSLRNKKFRILQKYKDTAKKKNLCLVLYTHNNEQKLRRILDCLKEQTYPAENTSIFVIMDNCADNSEKLPVASNVQKFVIKNQGKIGKKQAISILIEKIHSYSVIDAFVFLDINRYVENDFLASVNAALEDNDIVSGATILFGESLTIRQRIKSAYQKYKMNFLDRARACADLFTPIDSNVCAIKREWLDITGLPDFENLERDLEYTFTLAKEKCNYTFSPNIKTYCETHDFKIRIPRMSRRFLFFLRGVKDIFSISRKYTEFTIFQLCPNIVFWIASFAILIHCSSNYIYMADFSVTVLTICALTIAYALSLLNSNMRSREVFVLCLYPIYSFFHFVKHFFLWRVIKYALKKEPVNEKYEEKFEIDIEITDGRGIAPCKLFLINEHGMAKAVFMFRNKKITTKSHLRTYDAIDELIKKLSEYGYTIKICQACANFTSNHDGSTNLIKGFCKKQFQVSQEGDIPVVVWGTCKGFSPKVIVKNYRN